jgi:hypothetical protein
VVWGLVVWWSGGLVVWWSGGLVVWWSGGLVVPNPQSAIRNPQSAIRNPQSAIRNPQSAIWSSGSKPSRRLFARSGHAKKPEVYSLSRHRTLMETDRELLKGNTATLVLAVLREGPLHGYAIAQRLQQVSRDVVIVQQGTLYPALHRLEKRGALKAEWKSSDTGRDA